MAARRLDPDNFLCESCGYLLNGLAIRDHCPECGTPIAQSHPDRRIGTPWQRRGAVRATVAAVIRHPAALFDQAQPEVEKSRILKHMCLGAAGMSTAFVLIPVYVLDRLLATGQVDGVNHPILMVLIVNAALFGMPMALLLGLLTAIEKQGIRVFGRLRHRRIDASVAETIVGHAAAAWLTLPVLIPSLWVLGAGLRRLARDHTWACWELTLTAPIWAPAAASFVGMLWFEVVVWTGVRRMRFANGSAAAAQLRT